MFGILLLGLLPLRADRKVAWDGFWRSDKPEKVTDVQPVKRSTLFANMPFLRLRPGDQCVRARRWYEGGKGNASGFRDEYWDFVLSNGVYYPLDCLDEGEDKLNLYSAGACLLFDWEVSLENARKWKGMTSIGHEMSRDQYIAVQSAIAKGMPEVLRGWGADSATEPDRLVVFPGAKYVEFQGLAYDERENEIFRYVLRYGPGVYQGTKEILIKGPPRIDRSAFEGHVSSGMNDYSMPKPDAETARKAKEQYDRMILFREIVLAPLGKKPFRAE